MSTVPHVKAISPAAAVWQPKVVGFVCDWAVGTVEVTDASGRLKAHPSVMLIRVPCSGFIRPSWLEDTLKAGADGVFIVGCPYGDCLNREGNYLMRERVDQLQRRLARRKIPAERLGMLAHGLHDMGAFLQDVTAFVQRLVALGPPAPRPAAARPAAAASPPVPGEESGA